MSDTTPAPEATGTRTLKEQFSFALAKKAYVAGVGGAVAGLGVVSFAGVFADGKVDGTEVLAIGGAIVGGFVPAFLGAWLPSQPASKPTA